MYPAKTALSVAIEKQKATKRWTQVESLLSSGKNYTLEDIVLSEYGDISLLKSLIVDALVSQVKWSSLNSH